MFLKWTSNIHRLRGISSEVRHFAELLDWPNVRKRCEVGWNPEIMIMDCGDNGLWWEKWISPVVFFRTKFPSYHLVMTNSLPWKIPTIHGCFVRKIIYKWLELSDWPWYRWSIEIDGLPNLKMAGIFQCYVSHNQMVYVMFSDFW